MYKLSVVSRDVEGATVLDLQGRLEMGPSVQVLAHQIQQATEREKANVVLNMAEVTFIDSMGLGELVASYTTVKNNGGQFALAAPTNHVASVLTAARLPDVIKVYDTVDQAAAHLAQ